MRPCSDGMDFEGQHPNHGEPSILDMVLDQTQNSLRAVVDRMMRAELEQREYWIEEMAVDPEGRGIMRVNTTPVHWQLEEGIPFGHIGQFPSWDAVHAWRALGRPW